MRLPECQKLHFLGRLNKQEMRQEFLRADAFVFPTLSEGLAGVLLEAIACGCPVITTSCSGLDIADGESGLAVRESSADSLKDAVERLYIDRSLRSRIAENTRELSQYYSMSAWAQRLMAVVRTAAASVTCLAPNSL